MSKTAFRSTSWWKVYKTLLSGGIKLRYHPKYPFISYENILLIPAERKVDYLYHLEIIFLILNNNIIKLVCDNTVEVRETFPSKTQCKCTARWEVSRYIWLLVISPSTVDTPDLPASSPVCWWQLIHPYLGEQLDA